MIEPRRIHTVVLDVDDTLYPEHDYVLSGFAAVDAWLRAECGVRGFGDVARAKFDQGVRGKIFDEALKELGVPADGDLISRLVGVYRDHTPVLRLAEDAEEVLPWLATRFKLAALTDGYAAVQRKKLAALGLSRWIEFFVVTDELGREFWKPHPAGFERIMDHFGGVAAGFVYVADNPRKDFIAPRKLGWRTVRIRRAGGEHAAYEATAVESAEREISDLRKLMTLLSGAGGN